MNVYIALYTGFVVDSGSFVVRTVNSSQKGRFLLESSVSVTKGYTDIQTLTLPILVTSLMCIMILCQFLSYRALYVVNYVRT